MAVEKILMPKLGESVTEGIITKWLVKKGDVVEKYDSIAEVVSDKVTAEIPSTHSGVINEIIALEDVAYPCHAVICEIVVQEARQTMEEVKQIVQETITMDNDYSRRYSPAVKKLVREHNISLNSIKGTGIFGRITRKDVLSLIESTDLTEVDSPTIQKPVVKTVEQSLQQVTHSIVEERISGNTMTSESIIGTSTPFTAVRKSIANTMLRSKTEIPHAWMVQQADATNLVNYRNSIKENVANLHGVKLTYFPFFVYAVARLLEKYPLLNSSTDGQSVTIHPHIHLGVAVAYEKELFVPVIKNANTKSVLVIAKELNEFAEKAKTKTFTATDLTGSTFTINNTGSFGSVLSYGVIPPPNVAILQVEKIVKQPVVINDMIAIRSMVNLCLSLDHRLLDGLICGQFLQDICQTIDKEVKNYQL